MYTVEAREGGVSILQGDAAIVSGLKPAVTLDGAEPCIFDVPELENAAGEDAAGAFTRYGCRLQVGGRRLAAPGLPVL